MNVGFIGLGHMGRAMAVNLGKAGHDVRAWNRTRETTADLASKGLSIVSTPDEAFVGDAVISMLHDQGQPARDGCTRRRRERLRRSRPNSRPTSRPG